MAVYEHSANEALRESRPDPNVLFPGDVVVIPDVVAKAYDCATSLRHEFIVKRTRAWIRIAVRDEDDQPLRGRPWRLTVNDFTFEGVTDDEGGVRHEVAVDASRAQLEVSLDDAADGEVFAWELQLGHLDPIETVSGVQQRLNNLGYLCGTADGVLGARTARALRAFQYARRLAVTGALDSTVRRELWAAHGER
jgi:N-acetylmuramoyl-L-alanine amidase